MASDVTPSTVLVVDDDPSCRRLLSKLLGRAGFEVIEAVDGIDGYARVLSEKCSLVVTDNQMPQLTGIEMVRKLRASRLPHYPYIILATGVCDVAAGLDAGADDFIGKPIVVDELLPRLRAGQRTVALHESLRARNLELQSANDQLASLATTDGLTGLLNRRAFFERLEQEWQRSMRYDTPLAALMIDVDCFKRINDTFGHPAGDAVLRQVARLLQADLRSVDLVGRYGGEEFCVVLPETNAQGAALVAERIRQQCEQLELADVHADLHFTLSIGVCSRQLQTLSGEALVEHADQALLFAKRTGRNRVVRYDEIVAGSEPPNEHDTLADPTRGLHTALIPYQVVNTLLAALRFRDPQTVEHTQRVARLCGEFSRVLAVSPDDRVVLEIAALVHDVGKLATPDEILNKHGVLSDDEFAVAQRHREISVSILSSCFSEQRLVDIVRFSDRWYDGSHGEPAGERLPLGARVLAIVSLFDDLLAGRAWWQPHTPDEALAELVRGSGTQFDPMLVARFVELVRGGSAAALYASS